MAKLKGSLVIKVKRRLCATSILTALAIMPNVVRAQTQTQQPPQTVRQADVEPSMATPPGVFTPATVLPGPVPPYTGTLGVTRAQAKTSQVVLLGTAGGPFIRGKRSGRSSLLIIGNHKYLIDCGVGSLQSLNEAGYKPTDLDAIFLTNNHLDHMGGLADMLEYSSFEGRSRPISVVGPAGVREMVAGALMLIEPERRIFNSEGLTSTPNPASVFRAVQIDGQRQVYDDGVVKVTVAENSHYRLIPRNSPSYGVDRSYSMRFDFGARSIVFAGDTGPSAGLEALAQDADVLVTGVVDVPRAIKFATESMQTTPASINKITRHLELELLTPSEIGKLAAKDHVKTVVLTHFSPGADSDQGTEDYIRGIRVYFAGTVIIGADRTGLEID